MNAIPLGWIKVLTSDVAQIVGGGTPPSKDEACFTPPGQGIPWITPADLSGYRDQTISRGTRDLSTKGLASCSAKVMPSGTVLFSSRAPIGYVAIASNPVATNQGFKSFVLPKEIDSRFAYYQLKHIKPVAEALATGTTFKELSGSAAAKLPFLVAPHLEQKRIADKLDTVLTRVDAVNTRLARVTPLLKRFRQSVLAAATSGRLTEDWRSESEVALFKLGDTECQIPRSWETTTLAQLIDPLRPLCYGVVQPGPEVTDGVSLIRVQDMDRGTISVNELRTVGTSVDQEFSRSRVAPGDILVSVVGTIGRIAVVPAPFVGNIARAVARVSTKAGIEAMWVRCWLDSPEVQWWLTSASKEVARKTLNLGDLAKLPVPIPRLAEQTEIVRRVETLFAFANRLEARLQTAQTAANHLTPALLAKAFRGELVPQDPNDEPASELLKRLAGSTPASGAKRRRKKTSGASA